MTPHKASLLGLPPELRLAIYEAAFPDLASSKTVTISGTLSEVPGLPAPEIDHGPWALLSSCRIINRELKQLMPPVGDIKFIFENLTYPELEGWLSTFDGVGEMRSFEMRGWAPCHSGDFKGFHNVEGASLETHLQGSCHGCIELGDEDCEPGGDEWWEQLGYCWHKAKIELHGIEKEFKKQRVLERWHKDFARWQGNCESVLSGRWRDSAMLKRVETAPSLELALKHFTRDYAVTEGRPRCYRFDGIINCEHCAEEQLCDVFATRGCLWADGKLRLSQEAVMSMYAFIADSRNVGPWVGEREMALWEQVVEDDRLMMEARRTRNE